MERVRIGPRSWDESIHLILSSWNGDDLFRARGVGYNYVSTRAKGWLEDRVPEWVRIEPALTDNEIDDFEVWIPSPSLDDVLRELVRQGRLASAVIRYQKETQCSLAAARKYIDAL